MIYLCPLLYFYKSRLKSINNSIWWFFSYFIPFLLAPLVFFSSMSVQHSIQIVIEFLLLYECGYIWNDFISTRKENNPTNRLVFKNKTIANGFILIARNLFFLSVSFQSHFELNLLVTFVVVFFVFVIHNEVRGLFNIFTVCLLYLVKVLFVVVLFSTSRGLFFYSLCSCLSYVIPRTFHYALKDRFNISIPSKISSNRKMFTFTLNVISMFVSIFDSDMKLFFILLFPVFISLVDLLKER